MKARPLATDFLTVREFVAAYDQWAQQHALAYSRRNFARWAKVASPNFITLIVQGKRRLKGDWLAGFSRAAKLSSSEGLYLSLLDHLENSSHSAEQANILQRIEHLLAKGSDSSRAKAALTLSKNNLAWDILQMLDLTDCTGEPAWFKRRLRRPVTVNEVKKCLATLIEFSLIKVGGPHGYQVLEHHLSTPDQVRSAENISFHEFVLRESHEALLNLPVEQRNFGSLTLGVNESQLEEFKRELTTFGKMLIHKYGKNSKTSHEVLRLNLQLYPVTHQPRKKKPK